MSFRAASDDRAGARAAAPVRAGSHGGRAHGEPGDGGRDEAAEPS
jgi:hypothetical protein